MRLKQIGSNMTELEIVPVYDGVTKDSTWVLFSYETPVAGRSPDRGLFKTSKHFSATTTKHINKYFSMEWDIDPKTVQEIDQETIEGIVNNG